MEVITPFDLVCANTRAPGGWLGLQTTKIKELSESMPQFCHGPQDWRQMTAGIVELLNYFPRRSQSVDDR
jgi:hypothetical protein